MSKSKFIFWRKSKIGYLNSRFGNVLANIIIENLPKDVDDWFKIEFTKEDYFYIYPHKPRIDPIQQRIDEINKEIAQLMYREYRPTDAYYRKTLDEESMNDSIIEDLRLELKELRRKQINPSTSKQEG